MLAAILLASFLAQSDEPCPFDRDTAFGDAGGVRPALLEQGVSLTLAYTGEVLSNASGGLHSGTRVEHLLDMVLDVDLQKSVSWNGGSARVNPFWIEGQGLSEDHSGDLTRVSNIDARDGLRLFEAWLQQSAFDGRVSLRAGLLAADQEFALTAYTPLFLNGTFGMPIVVSANAPSPIYPVGAVGARLYVEPAPGFYAQAAVYDGDPGAEHENETGLSVRFSEADGVLAMVETGWRHESGAVKLGAAVHTAEFPDLETGSARRGNQVLYAVVEQKLSPSVGAFLRLGVAPRDRSLIERYVDAGVNVEGLIPGRDQDVLGVAAVWAGLSHDFVNAQADPKEWDHEILIEATYKVTLTKWISLQPDLQYIVHPGGTSAVDNALILGVRIDLLF
jgi:porin